MPKSNSKRSRVPRSLILRPHSFRRTNAIQLGVNSFSGFTSPSGSTIYGNGLSWCFQLQGTYVLGSTGNNSLVAMPNYAEFTSLFDQYRIKRVHVRMIASNNVSNATSTAGTLVGSAIPLLQLATDFDDNVPPSASTQMMEREDTRYLPMDSNGPKHYQVQPKYKVAASVGGALASLAGASTSWLDTNAADVQWFGTKLWMESQSSAGTQLQTGYIWLYFTYDYEFRTVQ